MYQALLHAFAIAKTHAGIEIAWQNMKISTSIECVEDKYVQVSSVQQGVLTSFLGRSYQGEAIGGGHMREV